MKSNNMFFKEDEEDLSSIHQRNMKIAAYEYLKNIQNNKNTYRKALFYEIRHNIPEKSLMSYLIDKKYVLEINSDNWSNYADEVSIDELIDILNSFNLETDGSKDELVSRIKENVDIENLNYYVISYDGLNFIDDNPVLDFYSNYLGRYAYNDFELYYNNVETSQPLNKIALQYLDKKEKQAIELLNKSEYKEIQKLKANLLYDMKQYDKSLMYYIKKFICDMNPQILQEYKKSTFQPIEEDTYNQILKLSENELDLEKIFNIACEDIIDYKIMIPKKEMLYYLKQIIKKAVIDELNSEIIFNIKIDEHNNLYYEAKDKSITTLDKYF